MFLVYTRVPPLSLGLTVILIIHLVLQDWLLGMDLEVLEVLPLGEVFEKWSQGHAREIRLPSSHSRMLTLKEGDKQ